MNCPGGNTERRRFLPAAVVCGHGSTECAESDCEADIHYAGRRQPPGLVARYFYRHGLFCASHPRAILVFTIFTFIATCFPLLTLPIYSTKPQTFVQSQGELEEGGQLPVWLAQAKSIAFIQQIVMKAMVHPYKKDELVHTDAFRGPLATAFKLQLEDLSAFQDPKSGLNMDHQCLRTDGVSSRYRSMNILPDYGCLILSPANLWGRDISSFQLDPNLISTISKYQRSREGHSSMTDLVFGMRQRDSGITNFPLRNRQRVISYATTVALKEYNPKFVKALTSRLFKLYPLHRSSNSNPGSSGEDGGEVTHIFFPPVQRYYGEMVPLVITIFVLFLYIYFSCNKIEVVRSKFGIACTAAVTVSSAICMSLGMSGLSLNANPKVYFVPYLVAFIGLENILVVTRSITETSSKLDVKIRVAQGLSQEGWNITKNLLCEMTVLSVVLLLGVSDSSVQEFCILAAMGLLADFFLQVFFFVTVLSMDMTSVEIGDFMARPLRKSSLFQKPISGPGIVKTSSRDGTRTTDVMAPNRSVVPEAKRVKLLGFFARKRIVQRLFVLVMLVRLSVFIYEVDVMEVLLKSAQHDPFLGPHVQLPVSNDSKDQLPKESKEDTLIVNDTLLSTFTTVKQNAEELAESDSGLKKLLHQPGYSPWKRLPYTHWPMLFGLYNVSLYGNYITLLPPIRLSMTISPESARDLRHPDEVNLQTAATADGDTDDFGDLGSPELSSFVPTSPGELLLAFIFAMPSILFISYLFVMLYRCVCSKNYAEWRASWPPGAVKHDNGSQSDIFTQMVQEASMIQLDGHRHEVESIAADCTTVLSMCLGGVISVWEAQTGEKLAEIDRARYFTGVDDVRDSCTEEKRTGSLSIAAKDSYSQPPPDFSKTINTNFPLLSDKLYNRRLQFGRERFQSLTEGHSDVNRRPSFGIRIANSSVWALDYFEGLILLGCSDGTIESWDANSSTLKCSHTDDSGVGITHLKLSWKKLVVARLTGHLEFYEVSRGSDKRSASLCSATQAGPSFASLPRNRCAPSSSSDRDVSITWLRTSRAHQQPITCLSVDAGVVLTGSQDHTLKICRLEDQTEIYTLHGHYGSITSVFIDGTSGQSCAGSGSQDGMLCSWDLMTGACAYSIQAHDGSVVSLTHSPSYIISMGSDDRLCVWERFHGHLINTISLNGVPHCHDLIMLTRNLIVTGTHGQLVVWDVRNPRPVRRIRLGGLDSTHAIKLMLHFSGDTVVCNYGNQLRIVRFPMLSDKKD